MNISALHSFWSNHGRKIRIAGAVLSIIAAFFGAIAGIKQFWGKPEKANPIATDFLYTVVGHDPTHRVVICDATFIVADPDAPVGLINRMNLMYEIFGGEIPKIGTRFSLTPSKANDGTHYARYAAASPDEAKAKAVPAKVTVLEKPKPASTASTTTKPQPRKQ